MHLLFLAFGLVVVVLTYIWNGNELGQKLANFPFVLKAEEERVFSNKNQSTAPTIEVYRSSVDTGPVFPQSAHKAETITRPAVTVAPVSFSPEPIRVNIDQSRITNQVVNSVRQQLNDNTVIRPSQDGVNDYTRM